MEIWINGGAANITLESERTVGDVLSGIEQWLRSSAFRLNGLELDGERVPSGEIPGAFDREIGGIRRMDIRICSRSDLSLEALGTAREYLAAFRAAVSPEERGSLLHDWEGAAAASFLAEELPELFRVMAQTLGSASPDAALSPVLSVLDERIREIASPGEEFSRMENLVTGMITRLEDLPLDIQTGKDGRAAETVSLFTNITEKLFRLFFLLQSRDERIGAIAIDSRPVYDFLEEFSTALKELLAAYETKDAVLVGDLAEYELAPRLNTFYTAIKPSLAL
jgi:hypothetical protein